MNSKPNPLYLTWEREFLGCYVSGHPVDLHADTAFGCCTHSVSDLADCVHKDPVIVLGVVTMKDYAKTGADERFVKFTFEDKGGSIDGVMWPKYTEKFDNNVRVNKVVVIRGKVTVRGNWRTLIAEEVLSPEKHVEKYPPHAVVQVDEFTDINTILTIPFAEEGHSRIVVTYQGGAAQSHRTIRLTPAVFAELQQIAGCDRVKVVTY